MIETPARGIAETWLRFARFDVPLASLEGSLEAKRRHRLGRAGESINRPWANAACYSTSRPSRSPNRYSLTFGAAFCVRIGLFLPIVSILPIIPADTKVETFILDFEACVAHAPHSKRGASSGAS